MDQTEDIDKRISKALFRAPAPPTAFETEAFVSRVMTRIDYEGSPLTRWLTGRWAVPALGLGIVALFFSIVDSVPQADDEAPAAWVLPVEDEP